MSSPARPQPNASFGTKLRLLFDTITPESRGDAERQGRRKRAYTDEEVADFVREYTGKPFSINYLGKLKADKSTPPSTEVAEALAVFFGMPPAYFFNDERSQRMMEQLAVADQLAKLKAVLGDLDANSVALRGELSLLDPDDLPVVTATMKTLRQHRESLAGKARPRDEESSG